MARVVDESPAKAQKLPEMRYANLTISANVVPIPRNFRWPLPWKHGSNRRLRFHWQQYLTRLVFRTVFHYDSYRTTTNTTTSTAQRLGQCSHSVQVYEDSLTCLQRSYGCANLVLPHTFPVTDNGERSPHKRHLPASVGIITS